MQAIDDEQMLAVLSPRIALLTWLQARPEARCKLQPCVIMVSPATCRRAASPGCAQWAAEAKLCGALLLARLAWLDGGGLLKKQVFTGFTPGFR